jgi:hypothetical protein
MEQRASLLAYASRAMVSSLVLGCGLLVVGPGSAKATVPSAWLVRAAGRVAASLSDGTVTTRIAYVRPTSRFPRVVLTGSFTCNACSRPAGASAPTGTVAEVRFDAKTRHDRDFALCKSRAQCDGTLCSFGACTRAQDALDVAFDAFEARLRGIPGDPDPFTRRAGTFSCHIHYPVREMRYIVGVCTTSLRLAGAHAAEVTLSERWRPREFEHGRWVRLPARTHTWRLLETDDGWRIAISSVGDPPPQLPRGAHR